MTTSNKCQGTIHTTKCETASAPVLTKRDCETVKTDVRDAEKDMSWFKWIATKDDSSRNPWVIFSKYNECKRLPQQLDAEAYTTLRDRLQAYDRGELPMSGQDAMELRRTVNLVQARYDGVPSPYRPKLADYISPAEQEIYDRFGNNLTMAVMPVTIPGIAGTRAMGGTEAQARAGGELSAMAFGFMGGAFMAKHGLLKQSVKPAPAQQTTSQPVPPRGSVGNGLYVRSTPVTKNGYDYHVDGKGRVTKAEGDLTLNKEQARNPKAQLEAGGADRLADDQGGHYMGRRFNGPTDEINHFAQNGNFNQGTYKALENSWERALNNGQSVRVEITPTYIGDSLRPSTLTVRQWIDGAPSRPITFNNARGGK